MKNILFLFLAFGLFTFAACGDDDNNDVGTTFDYHAHIVSPEDMSMYHMGDTLGIEVNFEEHNGGTVHHIAVRVYKKDDNSMELFHRAGDEHVHATSGEFEYKHDLELTADNGFEEHTDYILEAKVWGETDGEGEVISTAQFHVHPM